MNRNILPSLMRMLVGSFVLVLFFDFAYALMAFMTKTPLIYQSGLLSVAFLPLWLFALLDLRLKQKQGEEKELSARRSDHLFEQSFEHVVLERQVKFTKTKLQPLMVFLTMAVMGFVVYQFFKIDWQAETELNNSVQAAFLLFRGSIAFVLARYLQGVGRDSKSPHLETLAGLNLHHAVYMAFLSIRCFLNREGLEFLDSWTLYLAILPIALYFIEVPVRALTHYYSAEKPSTPPQSPKWLWLNWGKELGTDAQSAMTYQFGHDLSSSVREICRKNTFTLLPVLFVCIWLGSCFHLIPLGYQGILFKFEKVEDIVDPGLHFSLPWPLGSIESIQTTKIHHLSIGGIGTHPTALIWSEGGHIQETYLIFQDGYGKHDLPVEVYAVNALLTYRINNIMDYRFKHSDPQQTIRSEVKRFLTLGALQTSRSNLLEQERTELNAKWKDNLQAKLNELELGVELLHFGLPQVHPPKETSESFLELSTAMNKKDSLILEAQGEARQKKALQESATFESLQKAHAQAKKIIARTEGDHEVLTKIVPVANLNPELFTTRRTLQKLIDIKDTIKKVAILSPTPVEVQSLNLEPEFEPELLDLDLE